MPPTRDASRDLLEDRLDSWARWRKGANRITGTGSGSPLARLQAEGAEVDRGGRHVQEAQQERMRRFAALMRKWCEHKRMVALLPAAHPERGFHEREVERIRSVKAKTKRSIQQTPWASLITGQGYRADRSYPEEEATQAAIVRLPGYLRDAIEEMYLNPLPMDMKAREMGVSERTLRNRVKQAKQFLMRDLENSSGKV